MKFDIVLFLSKKVELKKILFRRDNDDIYWRKDVIDNMNIERL